MTCNNQIISVILPLYPRERDLVRIVQEAGWAPRPVWTGVNILLPTGIRSPDWPARKRVAMQAELFRSIITFVPLETKLN